MKASSFWNNSLIRYKMWNINLNFYDLQNLKNINRTHIWITNLDNSKITLKILYLTHLKYSYFESECHDFEDELESEDGSEDEVENVKSLSVGFGWRHNLEVLRVRHHPLSYREHIRAFHGWNKNSFQREMTFNYLRGMLCLILRWLDKSRCLLEAGVWLGVG